MWILDMFEDVESDLSVFHRVDNFRKLPSARFYSLASRLFHYDGAVRHRFQVAYQEMQPEPTAPVLRAVPDISPPTLAAMSDNPGFPGIEYAGG